jgi:Tfp pilus assembly protein PilF
MSIRSLHISVIAGLVIVVVAVYLHTLDAPFVLDDGWNIKDNPHIRVTELSAEQLYAAATKSVAGNRPLANVTFALNYYFSGGAYVERHFRIVNILIHAANAALVYLFAYLTFSRVFRDDGKKSGNKRRAIRAAVAVAALWALHPLHTQSVIYIVQRMTSLAVLFGLVACNACILARLSTGGRRIAWLLAAVASWVFGLACKEIVITAPILMWLHEWYFFRDLSKKWLLTSLKYIAVPALLIGLLVVWKFTNGNPLALISNAFNRRDFTMIERVLTQSRVVCHYLQLMVFPWPGHLNLDYDFSRSAGLLSPPTTLFATTFLTGLFAAGVALARRQRLISFAILWFFINLVLESSIIPLEMVFEHRTYLPSIAVVLVLVYAIECSCKKWPTLPLRVIYIVAAVLLAASTIARGVVWNDLVLLWEDCARKSPNKTRVHFNLGQSLNQAGRTERAAESYLTALRLDTDHPEANNNYGSILLKQGLSMDDALMHFERAAAAKPKYAEAHNNIGTVLARQKQYSAALLKFRRALELNPDYADALSNLGAGYASIGRFEEAIPPLERAVQLDPKNPILRQNLVQARKLLKKLKKLQTRTSQE